VEEVELPIRAGYFSLLSGIVIGGKTIPVFDMVADIPTQTPYIIIDGILPISENTKDSFMYELTVDLLVYTSFKGDFGSRKPGDLIVREILKRVVPSPGKSGVSAAGFNVYMAKFVGSNNELTNGDTQRTYRKRITFQHLAEQL